MPIMVKAACPLHRSFQPGLPGMTKRRVTQIMRKAQRFGQILIQPKGTGNRTTNLRHFDAVRQSNPEMIAIRRDKHLRLVAQATKGNGMDDPIAIPLKF